MGIDISGWIEVKKSYSEEWDGVVKIGFPLLQGGRNKEIYNHFFYDEDAIVGFRGFPERLSPEVEAELPAIKSYSLSQSWLNWHEMLLIDWNIMSADWQLLYDMMELLSKSHGQERVRMVIWFG